MRILVCDTIGPKGLEMLRGSNHQIDEKYELTPEQLKETIPPYDAVVVRSRTKISKQIIDTSRLRVIARAGVGLDNIDLGAAAERGIKVIYTPQAPSIAVAELVIGLIISLLREIPRADAALKQGRWLKKELTGGEFRGRVLGIAGFGRIGREVARRARAFGAIVQAYDVIDISTTADELGVRVASTLDSLLRSSDLVTLHLPLLPETRHIMNAEKIGMMKSSAYLINAARGEIVEESALLQALIDHKIAGAALDVYDVEPPTNLALVKLENVVCTPHIGAQTAEAQESSATEVARALLEELSRVS